MVDLGGNWQKMRGKSLGACSQPGRQGGELWSRWTGEAAARCGAQETAAPEDSEGAFNGLVRVSATPPETKESREELRPQCSSGRAQGVARRWTWRFPREGV